MNTQNFLIKLHFQDSIRKFRIPEATFACFLSTASDILQTNLQDDGAECKYSFHYLDDHNDKIRFTSDIEFSSAAEDHNNNSAFVIYVTNLQTNQSTDRLENNAVDSANNDQKLSNESDDIDAEKMKKIDELRAQIKQTCTQIREFKQTNKQLKNEFKSTKKARSSLKNKKTTIIDNAVFFDEMTDREKELQMLIMQNSLEIYSLKLKLRSIFLQIREFKQLHGNNFDWKAGKRCEGRKKCENSNNNNNNNKGGKFQHFNPEMRDQFFAIKEKKKVLKLQLKTVKLCMNSNNSETQLTDLKQQYIHLKNEIFQLRNQKLALKQQCKQLRAQNHQNDKQTDIDHHHHPAKDGGKWKEKKEMREKLISLRQQIQQIKVGCNYQLTADHRKEIESLKSQIHELKSTFQNEKRCHKRA